jgi:hypothetical protein
MRDNRFMAISQLTEFGPCACGGVIGIRSVEVRLAQDDGEPVVLDDVAQGACPDCGGRYYKAETLRVIEDEFRRIRLGAHAGTFLDQG